MQETPPTLAPEWQAGGRLKDLSLDYEDALIHWHFTIGSGPRPDTGCRRRRPLPGWHGDFGSDSESESLCQRVQVQPRRPPRAGLPDRQLV